MSAEDWKKQAEALFFIGELKVNEVSTKLGISRRSVSEHFNSLPHYHIEKERRKSENTAKRKDYQRQWDREHRGDRYGKVTGETMKQEHIVAVRILSAEKYYG